MAARGTSSERRSRGEWTKLVAAWTRSGLSAAVFARSRGLSSRTLTWWRWRLATTAPAAATVPPFVALEIAPTPPTPIGAAPAVEVVLAGGHVVRVHADTAPASLRVVLEALGAVPRAR